MRVTTLILLALVSCGRETGDCSRGMPDQCRAEEIVWVQGLSNDGPPPPVVWRQPDCTTEWGDPGFLSGSYCSRGFCATSSLWQVDLVWTGSFSSGAFAHELLHADQLTRGISDPGHTLPEWMALLPTLKEALAREGL